LREVLYEAKYTATRDIDEFLANPQKPFAAGRFVSQSILRSSDVTVSARRDVNDNSSLRHHGPLLA
jgi:hypothetical protein